MAIKSEAFGHVLLTGDDAAKFERQIKYGRPKPNAKENIERGLELLRQFRANGDSLTIKVKTGK